MALAWEHGVQCSPALCSVQSVSAGAAYKSLVLAAAWVMCSYRGHCTVCSLLQHQSSLLSLKNVWTSECSQVLQPVSQPALQQMQPLQASPGWLHRLLQCCRPNIRGRALSLGCQGPPVWWSRRYCLALITTRLCELQHLLWAMIKNWKMP